MRIILFLIFIFGLHGCASITQGTSQTLSFKLEPKETTCVLSRTGDGELGSVSSTSSTILVHKDKDDILVQCSAPGYAQKTTRIVSGASTAGVTGVLIDFGITDMVTGAMYAYPVDVTVVMEKESPTTPSNQTATQTREEKLKELKKINDAGLISKEIYFERQNEILRNP